MARDYFGVLRKARSFFSGDVDLSKIPSESAKEKERVDYVNALYKDSLAWRKKSLHKRFEDIEDPVDLWRKCRLLCNGQHFEVWGRRNDTTQDKWKHELVWTAIEDQKRIRKTYLSGWHDLVVTPNLSNINEILKQERDATNWREMVNLFVDTGLTEGTAFSKTILDKFDDPDGVVKDIVLDNESVLPTPYSTSLRREDGCLYLIYASMQNTQDLVSRYPSLDIKKLEAVSELRAKEISKDGAFASTQTKLSPVFELWLDDPKEEKKKFIEDEFVERTVAISDGIEVGVHGEDDHEEYVKRYSDWIEQVNSVSYEEPTERDRQAAITELTLSLIEEHIERFNKKPTKKTKKYPFGRKIVVVGGQLVEDQPNPFRVPWRTLFHKWDMERVPGSFWGRGIPEILWHSNKMLDIFLSRIADLSVTVSMPEKWMSLQDREELKRANITYTNDPTELKTFVTTPPAIVQGQAPQEFFALVNNLKESLEQKIGANDVTRGQSPGANSSGDLVEVLLRQNQSQLTGEANDNLNDWVEEVIEARIELYKVFYTEPRYYMIHGSPRAITVSSELKYQQVMEDGQLVKKEVPKLEVRVKPNSNFPNQWEYDLAFAIKMMTTPRPDGTPVLNEAFLYDVLAEQYPELGVGGKYWQLSEATRIGLQYLQAQAQKQQRDAETQKQVEQKMVGKGMQEVFNPQ